MTQKHASYVHYTYYKLAIIVDFFSSWKIHVLGRPKPDFMLDSLMGVENSAKSQKLVKTSTISHETKQIKRILLTGR